MDAGSVGAVIGAVCLNPAWDVTYRVESLRRGSSHRVTDVTARAGGKAVNVARVLAHLRHGVSVLAPLGGPVGADVAADLAAAGIHLHGVPIEGATRRTVTVVDGEATVFNEPGPTLGAGDLTRIMADIDGWAQGLDVVVLSGSLPPGLPANTYRVLARDLVDSGIQVVVDTSGAPLAALVTEPDLLLAPNEGELAEALGVDASGVELLDAAPHASGARLVVSAGARALLGRDRDGSVYSLTPPVVGVVNPTGAGDAVTAGIAQALDRGWAFDRMLAQAAALGSSAVEHDVAGDVDPDRADSLAQQLAVTTLGGR